MRKVDFVALGFVSVATLISSAHFASSDEPQGLNTSNPSVGEEAQRQGTTENSTLSIDAAREKAKVMHELYSATLDVMHERYFHGDRAIVPARAMEDVFAIIKDQSNVEARWISVNMKPMSVNHEPKDGFEKNAAKAIAAGSDSFEAVDGNYFRRAGAIHLGNGCVNCHNGFFKKPSEAPKFAGLVINVPIRDTKTKKSE